MSVPQSDGSGRRRLDMQMGRVLISFYLHQNVASYLRRASGPVLLSFAANLAKAFGILPRTTDAFTHSISNDRFEVTCPLPLHAVRISLFKGALF
jgi:hypothetical protein